MYIHENHWKSPNIFRHFFLHDFTIFFGPPRARNPILTSSPWQHRSPAPNDTWAAPGTWGVPWKNGEKNVRKMVISWDLTSKNGDFMGLRLNQQKWSIFIESHSHVYAYTCVYNIHIYIPFKQDIPLHTSDNKDCRSCARPNEMQSFLAVHSELTLTKRQASLQLVQSGTNILKPSCTRGWFLLNMFNIHKLH